MVRLKCLTRQLQQFHSVVASLAVEGIHTGEHLLAIAGGLSEQEIDFGETIDSRDVLQLVHYVEACSAAVAEPADLWLRRMKESTVIVPTGFPGLDGLLGGGIASGELLELVGRTSTGKTQFCLFTTLHTIVHESCVVFVDTGNAFPAKRLAGMYATHLEQSEGYEPPEDDIAGPASPEEFLVQIMQMVEWKNIYTAADLLHTLTQLQSDLEAKETEFYENVRLVVIDSLAAVVAPVLGGRDGFVGHSIMSQVARLLKAIACRENVAFLYTNYTVGGDGRTRPALGDSWSFVPNTRVQLTLNADTGGRAAELLKSARKARGERVDFRIGREGIIDGS